MTQSSYVGFLCGYSSQLDLIHRIGRPKVARDLYPDEIGLMTRTNYARGGRVDGTFIYISLHRCPGDTLLIEYNSI